MKCKSIIFNKQILFIFYFTFCNYSSTFTLTDFFGGESIAIETKVNNCHFRLNQQIVHRPALERKTFGFIWILNLVSQFCFLYFFSFNACSLFCICLSLACDAWRLKKSFYFKDRRSFESAKKTAISSFQNMR